MENYFLKQVNVESPTSSTDTDSAAALTAPDSYSLEEATSQEKPKGEPEAPVNISGDTPDIKQQTVESISQAQSQTPTFKETESLAEESEEIQQTQQTAESSPLEQSQTVISQDIEDSAVEPEKELDLPEQTPLEREQDRLGRDRTPAINTDNTASPQRQVLFPSLNTSVIISDPNDSLESFNQKDIFNYDTFQILIHCSQQVDLTPRTGKRLVNICKILQIIWKNSTAPTHDAKVLVIAFLALSSRYHDLMRSLFEEIITELEENGEMKERPTGNASVAKKSTPQNTQRSTPNANPDRNGQSTAPGQPDSQHLVLSTSFDKLLAPIEQQIPDTDYYTCQEWRRFRSDIARMFEDPDQPRPRGIDSINTILRREITIPSDIFTLTLSFSFVGDVGYDPEGEPPNPPPETAVVQVKIGIKKLNISS